MEVNATKHVPALQGVTGKKLRVLGSVIANVRVGDQVLKSKIVVVPDHYLHLPVLMGMDIIGRLTLTVDHKGQRVVFNNTVYPLRLEEHHLGKVRAIQSIESLYEGGDRRRGNFLRLRKKEEVKPYRIQFLCVVIEEPENRIIVVQPCHAMIPKLTSFVQIIREGKVWIPVANNSKQAVKLLAGTLLARYDVVEPTQLEEVVDSKVSRITEAMGPDNYLVEGSKSRREKLQQLIEEKDLSHLNQEQREQVGKLVMEYEELFIVEKGELGLIQQPSAHIQVDDPTHCRSHIYIYIYRYPEKAMDIIASILKDLEERDIIEKSTAAWLSPIVLVNKPSGDKRMCLDYRKVNKQLTTDMHTLSNLEELVEHVVGNQYYATLDLKDAYYQVLLDEASRDLTTFSEGINLYRFKHLPFGLSCSASIFVRQLQGALAPLLRQGCFKSYLDDIILCAPSFQLLLKRLGEVFQHMVEVGIELNLSKCSIGKREVNFLGYIVSEEGFRPDSGNVEAIIDMKPLLMLKRLEGSWEWLGSTVSI